MCMTHSTFSSIVKSADTYLQCGAVTPSPLVHAAVPDDRCLLAVLLFLLPAHPLQSEAGPPPPAIPPPAPQGACWQQKAVHKVSHFI